MLSSSKKPEVADITYTLDSYVRVPVQTYFKQPYGVLGLYLTNKCNIMCRHCCVSSGPRESTQLAIDDVLSQVPDLVAAGIAKAIHVSGGEPFLYQDALRRIAQVGYEAGIPVGINTNAFWARSVSAAHKVSIFGLYCHMIFGNSAEIFGNTAHADWASHCRQ